MSKAGDSLVRCCNRLQRFPALVLCFVLIILQDAIVDYYIINHLRILHLLWTVGDLVVLVLVMFCFLLTSKSSNQEGCKEKGVEYIDHSRTYTLVWVTWLVMQTLLAIKVVVICSTFSTELDEDDFFGPNTLKTGIALGSCIFVLILTSQHEAGPSDERRRYIEELTGTVMFDLLDTADILDVLFDADARPDLSSGLPEFIMAVAFLNLLLPTVPLITLSRTKFGLEKMSKRMVYIHRILLVLAVNVPNLLVRMLLWHGFSVGISPFTLKNIIIICMTAYEFYEHKKEKFEMHEQEELEMNNGSDKFNSSGEMHSSIDNKDSGINSNRHSRTSAVSDEVQFSIENRIVTGL